MDREENTGSKVLVLTYCTKRKKKEGGPARRVYAGPTRNLFVLAEKLNAKCYILSAKHGLISCDDEIEPYELYLDDLGKADLEKLKEEVEKSCSKLKGPWKLAVVNLSAKYAKLLESCTVYAEYAIVLGKFYNVRARRTLHIIPKTIGERSSLLKLLGGMESLEDVLRFVEERTGH